MLSDGSNFAFRDLSLLDKLLVVIKSFKSLECNVLTPNVHLSKLIKSKEPTASQRQPGPIALTAFVLFAQMICPPCYNLMPNHYYREPFVSWVA